MSEPAPRPRLVPILVAVILAVAVLALALYAARRTIAQHALVGWLKARGSASEAVVDEIGPGGATAHLRVGDPRSPDFVAGDAEVTYGLRGFALEVRTVTLKRPQLRARWHDGKLSVGSLDPLIAEFLKRPPQPNARKPQVRIEGGVVQLTTDYGPVRVTADATVNNGKLMALSAVSAPARLRGARFGADLGTGRLSLITRRDRVDSRLEADVIGAVAGAAKLGQAHLVATANAPYPDLVKHRGDGAVTAAVRLTAASLGAGAQVLKDVDLGLGFSGQAVGWIPDLAVSGRATADLHAAGGGFAPAKAGPLRVAVSSDDVRWTRKGGDALAATLRLTGTADRVDASSLTLTKLVVAGKGPLAADAKGVRLGLGGSVLGHGRWQGFGEPTKGDSAQIAALKRAALGFGIAAPAVQLDLAQAASVRLVQPLRLLPDRGGEARLVMRGDDAALVTVRGGGLPTLDASLSSIRLANGGGSAALDVKAGLTFGPAEGAHVDAAGRATVANGRLTLAATRCAQIDVAHLEFGERDVERLSGRLCPSSGPLLSVAAGGWRVTGRAEGAAAEIPWLQAELRDAAGPVTFAGSGSRLSASATLETGRVSDTAPGARFNPLILTGPARLDANVWIADLALKLPRGPQIATLALRHEVLTGKGGVEIETGPLRFADGGLQPAQLSPLAEAVGSPATGEAKFSGFFAWAPEVGISYGTLTIPGLDFKTRAGQVHGLSGKVVLTSLAPLVAAPGQQLRAERLDAIVPVTDLKAGLSIKDEVLSIAGGEAAVEGGRVRIESLDLPLKPDAAIRGTLLFDGVQLKNLVEASPFRDFMDLDAKVSGRVPFEAQVGRVRIAGGDLKAIQPGRLSIDRKLFTQAAAGTVTTDTPAAADPNQTFQDLAYQAMENLAFDELTATLNSQADGRMGVLFHIVGRHDPPRKAEIRLSIMDLIKRRFLNRPLPLPSGTKVNLTLDTTMNLDQLLADYAEVQRAR